jgi:hypothetical protein
MLRLSQAQGHFSLEMLQAAENFSLLKEIEFGGGQAATVSCSWNPVRAGSCPSG